MKNLMKLVAAALSAVTISVYAGGGNGGGGFCYANKKCVTLAEAGLRIPQKMELFMISEDLEKELRRIVETLPLSKSDKKIITSNALGARNTFIPLEKKDDQKFSKIIKEYKKLIKTYSPGLSTKNFVLWAVSAQDKKETYLLPQFFELELTEQAYILIHESNVRNRPSSVLESALRFDQSVFDFSTNSPEKDFIALYLGYAELYPGETTIFDYGNGKLFMNFVTYFGEKIHRNLRLSDFCEADFTKAPSENPGSSFLTHCKVERKAAMNGDKTIDPRFSKLFYGSYLESSYVFLNVGEPSRWYPDEEVSHTVCQDIADGERVFHVMKKDGEDRLYMSKCLGGLAVTLEFTYGYKF